VPARRGSFQARGHAPSRRRTGWELGPGGDAPLTVSADGISILGSGLVLLVDGLTLVRLRGSVQALLTQATAIADGFHCAMGIGIVNEDAFAIGVTTIMDPLTDADWDGWLYHRFFDLHAQSSTTVGPGPADNLQFEVDSKAMRKTTDGDVIFAALEVVEQTTAVMQVFFDSRVLFKLP